MGCAGIADLSYPMLPLESPSRKRWEGVPLALSKVSWDDKNCFIFPKMLVYMSAKPFLVTIR